MLASLSSVADYTYKSGVISNDWTTNTGRREKNRKGSEVDFLGDTDIVRYKFNSNVAESEI